VITGTTAGQATTDEATLTPFSGVAISDVDVGQTETVTVTLSNHANGTLSNLGGGSYNSATGVYSISGTDAAVSTAVDGLVFTPTAHQVAPGSSVTTTFTIQATDTAGGTSSNSTTTVAATAVNDPPVIAGATAGQATTDEATVTPFSGVTISDPDFGASETVTITLTAGLLPGDANGILSGASLTKTGIGTYTLSAGTPAAVTAALRALVFTPTAHEVAPGGTVTTGMTLSVTDGIVN
jgi:VCBS repeat-containing protein